MCTRETEEFRETRILLFSPETQDSRREQVLTDLLNCKEMHLVREETPPGASWSCFQVLNMLPGALELLSNQCLISFHPPLPAALSI